MLYASVRFLESDSGVMVMSVYVLVLERYMLKYLGVKGHEACNLFANDLTILQIIHTEIKLMWGNVGLMKLGER